jgi:NAD(P)-dependent dehydrogenase (short-subunit alcohol dehydrogenase family)
MIAWNGKVVVVTGAATGIGAATAALFAQKGASVVLADMNAAVGEDNARKLSAGGGKALFVPVDVTRDRDITALADKALSSFGRIDALVNNAGIMIRHDRIEDWKLDEWRRIIDVNLTALFVTSHAMAPLMGKSGGGVIVNIASVGGLTRSLSVILEQHKVRVNAILPMLVDTPMTVDSPARNLPGLMLQPGDIARGVAYAAGNEALNNAFLVVGNTDKGVRLYRVEDPPPQKELPDAF